MIYWPTGNPAKEYDGTDRKGDNLYAGSILALQRADGKLKWYYQFTPHDLWDWDATQTSVLVDAAWQGTPRKLMLHANRNGFFYVFDRTDGKLLLAKPFIKLITWASGIGADGRPVKLPNQEPSPAGTSLPVAGRRHELVLAVLQPVDRAVLRPDQREVQCLHQEGPGKLGERQDLSRRLAAHRRRPQTAAHSAGDRHPVRGDQVGSAAAGHGQLLGRHAVDRNRSRHRRRGRRGADGWTRPPGKLLWNYETPHKGGVPVTNVERRAIHRRRRGSNVKAFGWR